jgi:hypothetical protein
VRDVDDVSRTLPLIEVFAYFFAGKFNKDGTSVVARGAADFPWGV